MNSGRTRNFRKRPRTPNTVLIDVEKFEIMGLSIMEHWCFDCKAMRRFNLREERWEWRCESCNYRMLAQQLIIEGRLSESKYRGIDRC